MMKAQLEDKRTQGDNLNTAEARLRKAKANHEKRETALKEAQEAMDEAKLELAAILKQVKADLAPEIPETQQTDEVLRLGAGDVREPLKLLNVTKTRIDPQGGLQGPYGKSRAQGASNPPLENDPEGVWASNALGTAASFLNHILTHQGPAVDLSKPLEELKGRCEALPPPQKRPLKVFCRSPRARQKGPCQRLRART